MKKLKRRLKKVKRGEKKNIEEKIARIENKKSKFEEENFEIIVNTLANKRRAKKRLNQQKKEEEMVRQQLVKEGLIEDKIHMNSKKYRMDGDELQDYIISKLLNFYNKKVKKYQKISDKLEE